MYRLTTGRRDAFLLGACLSIAVELLQLLLPDRTPSVVDVLTNMLGAAVGAFLYEFISDQVAVTPDRIQRLRLETPLMGLTYLLIPLLWINTLALPGSPGHQLLTLLLAACGAIIFSDLFRQWWQSSHWQVSAYACIAYGLWFLIGTGPSLLTSPSLLVIGAAMILFTALLSLLPWTNKDRRFERRTLLRLLPFFALYLILLTLGSPFHPLGEWHMIFGFTNWLTDNKVQHLYPRLEYLLAFTSFGYLIAEARGRLELPLRQDLPHLFLIVTIVALLPEVLSGFQVGRGASVIRFVLAVVGALFGGTIYHTSRAHIRFVSGR